MPRAIVIGDGEFGVAELVDMDTELHTLQDKVGGYIEAVDLGDVVLIMDEEGKIKRKDVNMRATEYLYVIAPQFRGQDFLVGTVIVYGGRGGDDPADVPQAAIEYFDLV